MHRMVFRLPQSQCLACFRRVITNRQLNLSISRLHDPLDLPHTVAGASYQNRYFSGTHFCFGVPEKNSQSKTTNADQKPHDELAETSQDLTSSSEKLGIFERFRQTYRQYGKILIGVHIGTSAAWACTFYYVASSGFDIIALLNWLGANEKVIAPFTTPGVGHAAIAYLMFKLASPLRYGVTIGGTHLTVRALQRLGYMPPVPPNERIRSLVKEKLDDIKERRSKEHKL